MEQTFFRSPEKKRMSYHTQQTFYGRKCGKFIVHWCQYYTKFPQFYKMVPPYSYLKNQPYQKWTSGRDMTTKLFSVHKQSLYSQETPKTWSEHMLVVGPFLPHSSTTKIRTNLNQRKLEPDPSFWTLEFFLRHNL